MPPIPTKNVWVLWAWDAGERGLRAYAASFASLVGADQAFSKFDLGLLEIFEAAFVGLIVSTLFSLAGKRKGSPASGSLLSSEKELKQADATTAQAA
jgi:hypothetical protein